MIQTYFHHACGIFGALLGNYVGGFFGSISQLTWITELSTPFTNGRALLAYHKKQDSVVYLLNGLMMLVSFFVVRVCYYYYMIFNQMQIYCMYRSNSFWHLYPAEHHKWCYLAMFLYFSMYILQLFWFSKILDGFLKAIGLNLEAVEEKSDKEKDD